MSGADLQRELTDLAETEEPPTGLDIDRAVRSGKRRNRIRTAATAATAAACAAAVAIGSVAIPSALGDRGPERPAAPEESTPRPMPPAPDRVDTTHNPMVTHARFGWLPDSITTIRYVAGPGYGDNLTALGETSRSSVGRSTDGRLFLSTSDEDPGITRKQEQDYPDQEPHRIPTTIDGREGYWLTFTEGDRLTVGQGSLRWKLPNGRWALLKGSQMAYDDPVQVMERVAADVRAGDRLEPLPVRVSSLPDGFSLVTAYMERPLDSDPAKLSVSLVYMFKGSSVTIGLGADADAKQGGACKTENDMKVCVSAFADAQRVLESVGGPQGLLNRVTALGYDRSEWTTEVIG